MAPSALQDAFVSSFLALFTKYKHFYWNTRKEAVVLIGGIWEYFPEQEGLELDFIRPLAGGSIPGERGVGEERLEPRR